MSDDGRKRLHARIAGRVQGVGFRYFVQRSASEKGINGWVRNRWDRSVEVVAEGADAALERLLENLRTGPPGARVDQVDLNWEDASGEFTSFKIRSNG
jgi:acylphosphatase